MALFNKSNFNITDFCAKSSTRPELEGIFVQPTKTIATNSFILIEVSTLKGLDINEFPAIPNKPKPKTNFKPFILSSNEAQKLIKPLSKKQDIPILENAVILQSQDDFVEIGTTDLQSYNGIYCKPIQGEFPQVNDILVERGKFVEINVNPEYLVKIGKFYSQFLKGTKTLKIKVPVNPNEPIRFYGKTENQDATALLMPIKAD